ncbi:MAG TPA: OmpH family outer membrane protein [Bacteroidales bacterium]|nr:OmpH family outer membrane protein [Bacteroidales bacterium]
MKKLLFTAIMLWAGLSFGQRFAYIDTEYILDNIPEFKAAEQELEQLSMTWQREIEEIFGEVDRLYREYQAEAPLLPEDMRRRREETIIEREREAKNLQMQRFGREGDLFQKRQELIKPIQDRVFRAVEELATNENYAVIFDKAGSLTMIFTDVRFDLSDQILRNLGYRR